MAQRKFECWQCHNRFEADDQGHVECPHCHSDNVEYAHFHLPKGTWKWVVGILICCSFVWLLSLINWSSFFDKSDPQADISYESDTIIIEKPDSCALAELTETELKLSPTVDIKGKPVYEDGGYTFSVNVKNAPPQGTYYVVALDHFDTSKVIARSDDGHFTLLPPSKAEGGQYDFAVCSKENDSLLCDPVPRTGFLPVEVVTERKGKEWLQKLIDTNDDLIYGTGNTKYIAPDYKINIKGTKTEDQIRLSDVAGNVSDELWKSATITSVDYDDMNRISVINITVVE